MRCKKIYVEKIYVSAKIINMLNQLVQYGHGVFVT